MTPLGRACKLLLWASHAGARVARRRVGPLFFVPSSSLGMEAVSLDAQGRPLASTVGAEARDLPLTPERVLDAVAAGATSCEAARP